MNTSTSSSFSVERLHYFQSAVDSEAPVLVGVFMLGPTGTVRAFYSAPLGDADEMDRAVVNGTLTDLRETSDLRSYRELLSGAGNVLRLTDSEPLYADDTQSAMVEAMRLLMDSRPDMKGDASKIEAGTIRNSFAPR